MKSPYELLADTLKKDGHSLTKPRQAVFAALQSGTAKTMRELILDLSSVIDRASIYRTVSLFEDLGIVVRVNQGWKYKVELSDIFSPHHHHITCIKCNRIISFEEPEGFDSLLTGIALSHGFIIDNHSLEITGTCPQCQRS